MKKISFILFSFIVASLNVFSLSFDTEMAVMFPSTQTAYPQSGDFENIIDAKSDSDLLAFKAELAKDFSIEWCDSNFNASTKAALASALSPLLSKLLPCKNVIFSKPTATQDGLKNFKFKSLDTGNVYFVILQEGKIISITRV